MDTDTMRIAHQAGADAPWQWQLPPRAARRLSPAPLPRWLAVQSGSVWLTRSHDDFDHGEDIWLGPGERQLLPAGSEWVAEGHPEARVVVLEAPPG